MAMEGNWYASTAPESAYRYNGIEHTPELGLGVYNAFYRTLDPAVGRWWQVDPAAEVLYGHSPYAAMMNSPQVYNDPDGDIAPLVVAGLIGAAIGGVGNLAFQAYHGNINSIGDGFAAFGIGAGAGFVTGVTGGATAGAFGTATLGASIASGATAGALAGASGGFLQGTGNALYFGNSNIGEALGQGLNGALWGAAGGAVIGGAIGGLSFKSPTAAQAANDPEVIRATVETGRPAIKFPDGKVYIDTPNGWVRYGGVARAGNISFKSFTSGNFRYNLGQLTGKLPANAQAHHVFPQKFRSIFSSKGINIDNPKFGIWWETTSHLKNAGSYNARWAKFLSINPSKSQILDFGRQLMNEYGFPVGF